MHKFTNGQLFHVNGHACSVRTSNTYEPTHQYQQSLAKSFEVHKQQLLMMMYMYLLIEFLVILQEMNAYITLFPKAVSHFFQLLAHTFPEKLPGIRNVSQPQKLFWSINVFIHTWGLHVLGAYWNTTWQYISILCNDKRTERWYTGIT